MTAKDAMIIGMNIAKKHRANVLVIGRMNGSSDDALKEMDRALNGCEIDLASQIMVALGKVSEVA